jgi:ElaB/YqjD/DUF883 family membrane-anchored ribosome-binding protein
MSRGRDLHGFCNHMREGVCLCKAQTLTASGVMRFVWHGTCLASEANTLTHMETQTFQAGPMASLQAAKSHALEAAGDLRHAAEEKVVELREVANAKAQHLKSSAQEQVSELEHYVRENPTKSVMVSLGVGMLVGMLWRR